MTDHIGRWIERRWPRRRRSSVELPPPGPNDAPGTSPGELQRMLAEVRLDGTGRALQQLISTIAHHPERHRDDLRLLANEADADTRFKALYLLFYIARRNKDYGEQQRLARELTTHCSDVPVVAVLAAEAAAAGQTAEGPLRSALRLAEEAARECPQISGSHFVVAEIALSLHEAREYSHDLGEDNQEQRELIRLATKTCEQALRIRPDYPKYLAFSARLHALEGRFEEAYGTVTRAIDLESPQLADYAVRISDYQLIKMEVRYRQYGARLRLAQDKAVSEMSLARLQVLELMGLLAAVIAFLVTGTQVALSAVEVDAGLRFIVVMSGCILLVFSAFSFVFGLRRHSRHLVGGLVGLALLLGPIVSWPAP